MGGSGVDAMLKRLGVLVAAGFLGWSAPAAAQTNWSPALEGKCAAKDAVACWTLGETLLKGQGVTADPKKAVGAFVRACDLGVAEACYIAATRTDPEKRGTNADAMAAAGLFTKGCEAGLGSSCLSAGIYTEQGWGVSKDHPRALMLYERGCTLRDGESCRYLSQIWAFGEAINNSRTDGPKTLDWSVKGCNAGDGPSCVTVSWLYAGNMGIGFNQAAGERYARMGCGLDHADSCYNLGYMVFQRKDYVEARNFYARSCRLPGGRDTAGACKTAGDLNTFLANRSDEDARYEATQRARADEITRLLGSGDYNGAMYRAAYGMGSIEQVNRILLAASSAGRLPEIDDIYFVAFQTWNISSQARNIVTAEKRRRDAAQRQAARLAPAYGGSSSSWSWTPSSSSSSSSSGSTYTPPRISESDIYRNARENTRTTYCNAGWGCR
ncbi:tetratricopeptide repeat protein [Sphingomonas sp. AOB5]|uniref:tetratricopeptide repeat protein n=1 Tax=Sphingomonas sp. AOB5 TaxID=3034017 RepID=UPI0023F9D8F9|nr:tetratricopeptide repeat protein [Sphingomonas sp. AOB5]MDF7776244.1 tetratricopeptide repeat protein [Sphingomonas sp. AOB5]